MVMLSRLAQLTLDISRRLHFRSVTAEVDTDMETRTVYHFFTGGRDSRL